MLGDESGGLTELRDVVGSLGHREGKAVRGERDVSAGALRRRELVQRRRKRPSERTHVARVVVELAKLVDHRRSGADLLTRRASMSSRYWRQEECELNPDVTKARARSTPSSRIWRTASTT